MKNKNSGYQKRLERCEKAIQRKVPDRVPVVANIYAWAENYYGYSVKEVYDTKPELTYDVHSRLAKEFDFDAFFTMGNNVPIPATNALGGGHYIVTEKGLQVSNLSCNVMNEDEYPLLAKDPAAYFRDYLLPRKYPVLNETGEKAYEALCEAFDKFGWYMKKTIEANKRIEADGYPVLSNGAINHPLDSIMDFCRDFSGVMTDIRRHPDELKNAMESFSDFLIHNSCDGYRKREDSAHFLFCATHIAPFLKPKDFEEFYFPYFRAQLDYAMNTCGYTVGVFMEGNWEPYYELLQELPDNDGKLVCLQENGDCKKFKEKLGNKLCVCGGVPISLLAFGSEKEVQDCVKRMIDDCAADGGFMISTDKGILTLGDAKPENIKAMIEAVKMYGTY